MVQDEDTGGLHTYSLAPCRTSPEWSYHYTMNYARPIVRAGPLEATVAIPRPSRAVMVRAVSVVGDPPINRSKFLIGLGEPLAHLAERVRCILSRGSRNDLGL